MMRELEAAAGLLAALLIIAGTAAGHAHVGGPVHRDLLGKGVLQPSSRVCGLHVVSNGTAAE